MSAFIIDSAFAISLLNFYAISKMCSSDRRSRALKRGPQWRVPLGQNDLQLCIYKNFLGYPPSAQQNGYGSMLEKVLSRVR